MTFSHTVSLKSLFYLHNETFNIYTHLIGALTAFGLILYSLLDRRQGIVNLDNGILAIFSGGAFFCLMSSTIFHTFCCHSAQKAIHFSKLDYIGIVVLIQASFITLIYFGFYCDRLKMLIYISVLLAVGFMTVKRIHNISNLLF